MIQMKRLGVILRPENAREALFNAGMVRTGDRIQMLYRYALSHRDGAWDPARMSNYAHDYICAVELDLNGQLIGQPEPHPVLFPTLPEESAGCQDPRIVPFEGRYLAFYCAWDKNTAPAGSDLCRVAIAETTDFRTWHKLGFVTESVWDKDAFIFPERIDGQILYIHRIAPDIQIDRCASLAELLDPASAARRSANQQTLLRPVFAWENLKIGGGPPPLRTEAGWLLIYHGVEQQPGQPFIYRAGAALLDLDDPTIVRGRLPEPLFSPETVYERYGDVPDVVFPIGLVDRGNDFLISYGGADTVVALMAIDKASLLEELLRHPVAT